MVQCEEGCQDDVEPFLMPKEFCTCATLDVVSEFYPDFATIEMAFESKAAGIAKKQ